MLFYSVLNGELKQALIKQFIDHCLLLAHKVISIGYCNNAIVGDQIVRRIPHMLTIGIGK